MWHVRGFTLRRAVFTLLSLLLMLLLALLLAACEREPPPQLLTVTDLLPREVELGDKLELSGDGFPQGRRAEVHFRGTLRRPGETAIAGIEVSAEGSVAAPQTLEVRYDEVLEASFCRSGERLAHTTFLGEVEVAFPAAAAGAPPITATLHGVELDLRPPRNRVSDDAREGERTLGFLGLTVEGRAAPLGLVVSTVEAGSRGEQAGLARGDVLTSMDGLRLGALDDALPAPHVARVILGVRRPGSASDEQREISLLGYRAAASENLLPGAVLLAATLALLLLFALPPGPRRAWLELRLFSNAPSTAPRRSLLASIWPTGPGARRLHKMVIVFIGAGAASLPLTGLRGVAQLDVGTVGGLLVTGIFVAALLTAGGEGPTTLRARLTAAFSTLSFDLLAALCLGSAVIASGSVRLHDIACAQGGAPWEWNAFRTPATLLAALLSLVALASPRPARHTTGLVEADRPLGALRADEPSGAFALAAWVHLGLGSVLVATLFLGAFRMPGVGVSGVPGAATGAFESRLAFQVLGALLLLGKSGVVAGLALRLRASLPGVSRGVWLGLTWQRLLPLAGGALLVTQMVSAWAPPHRVQVLVGGVTFVLFVAAVLHLVQRRRPMASQLAAAELDPFL